VLASTNPLDRVVQRYHGLNVENIFVGFNYDYNVTINSDKNGITLRGKFGNQAYDNTAFLTGIKIVSISLGGVTPGEASIYAISDKGVAYAFGKNDWGYLADGTLTDRIWPILSSKESEKVFAFHEGAIAYGSRFEFWSKRNSTQIDYTPMISTGLDSRVTQVVGEMSRWYVLTEAGSIYGIGLNSVQGDLGGMFCNFFNH
jgi:alpha-tubulin suppressor-like RCC1 family protein